jgi:hypothetical protein
MRAALYGMRNTIIVNSCSSSYTSTFLQIRKIVLHSFIMASNESNKVSITGHFDGKAHLDWAEKRHYQNPSRDLENGIVETHRHRDFMSRITYKPRDLLWYIHPENCKPCHMLV